jgi:hypothetical protein
MAHVIQRPLAKSSAANAIVGACCYGQILCGTGSGTVLTDRLMGEADRIRRLAARNLEPEAIAEKLKVRPAIVRRVLGRSAKRGPPRTRDVSATLSFVTAPEIAAKVRAEATQRGVSISILLDEMVRQSLRGVQSIAATGDAGPDSTQPAEPQSQPVPVLRARAPRTAADAPESVVKLLKSYAPNELWWRTTDHRHLIVVAILTRGNAEAKDWLWSVLSLEEVRDLVRQYAGAGCAEPARAQLREQLGLTTADIPTRAYLGMGR